MKTKAVSRGVLTFLFFLFAVPVPAVSEEMPAVAVMDFAASNAPATEASIMADFVRSAVVRSAKFKVVDKKNMQTILTEQAFQQTGCTSSECAVKLGKLLNVQKMIVGNYGMLGGIRYMSANLVNVETGVIERSGQVKDIDPKSVDRAADDLVSQLTGIDLAPVGTPKGIEAHPLCVYMGGYFGVGGIKVKSSPLYSGTKGGVNYSWKASADGLDQDVSIPGMQLGGRYYILEWLMVDAYGNITGGYDETVWIHNEHPQTNGANGINDDGTYEYKVGIASSFSGGITLNYVKSLGKYLSAYCGFGAQSTGFTVIKTPEYGIHTSFGTGGESVYYSLESQAKGNDNISYLAQAGLEIKVGRRLGLSLLLRYNPPVKMVINGHVSGKYWPNSTSPAQVLTDEDINLITAEAPGLIGLATLGYYF